MAVVAILFGERKAPRRHAAGPLGGGRRAASLYARLPPAKNRRPQPDAGESCRSKLPSRARCTSTCPRSLSNSVFRAFLGENARPAREVGDPAWDRYWPGLLAEVDDALTWSSTGPGTVPVQDGARRGRAALLEDVTDRALRSEFKPDDGAGAGVVAEAVGDQSAQRPVLTGSGDVMKVTMHFHN